MSSGTRRPEAVATFDRNLEPSPVFAPQTRRTGRAVSWFGGGGVAAAPFAVEAAAPPLRDHETTGRAGTLTLRGRRL